MNKPNSPGAFSVEIKDWREKALQRAIMLKGVTRVGHTEIRWLDIELPVHCTGWARGASIDLIGVDTDDNYVLCELKFGGKGADSVEFAERELLGYVDSIAKNEASCIAVGDFYPQFGEKRCERGARSAECLQRAA